MPICEPIQIASQLNILANSLNFELIIQKEQIVSTNAVYNIVSTINITHGEYNVLGKV